MQHRLLLHFQIIQSWLRFFAIAKTNINNNIIISTVRITLFLTDQNVIHDYILLDQFTIENNLCISIRSIFYFPKLYDPCDSTGRRSSS
jgi:hypothetical protein